MNIQDKERLIQKYCTARYIADKVIGRHEILCEAIQIAVEQVQDIEIDILKIKSETKVDTLIIDIIMLYFIEAKVIGTAVQKIAQKMTTSYFSSTKFLNEYFSANIIEHMNRDVLIGKLSKEVGKINSTIAQLERITTDALTVVAKVGEKKSFQTKTSPQRDSLFDKGTGPWANAAQQHQVRPVTDYMESIRYKSEDGSVKKYIPNIAKGFPINDGGDSISVALLRCAFAKHSAYKIAVNSSLTIIQKDIMLLMVSEDELTVTDLENTLDEMIKEDKAEGMGDIDYDQIRNYLSVQIEKIIWVALYGAKIDMAMGRNFDLNQINDAGVIKGIDADDKHKLQNYWWARFPDPQTGFPFPNKYQLFIHLKETYQYLKEVGIEKVLSSTSQVSRNG